MVLNLDNSLSFSLRYEKGYEQKSNEADTAVKPEHSLPGDQLYQIPARNRML